MTIWQCNSCGGIYADTCADGETYYHACPPIKLDPASTPVYSPDRRDENLLLSVSASLGAIVAEGKGRAPAPPPAPDTTPPPAQAGGLAGAWQFIRNG